MLATVVAVGAAVGRGERHGGGQVDMVAVGGKSVSEGCPSLVQWSPRPPWFPCQRRKGPAVWAVDPTDWSGWSGLRERGGFPAGSWTHWRRVRPWGSRRASDVPGGPGPRPPFQGIARCPSEPLPDLEGGP
jgi:hypothetical protein